MQASVPVKNVGVFVVVIHLSYRTPAQVGIGLPRLPYNNTHSDWSSSTSGPRPTIEQGVWLEQHMH